jgi:hypothetical protein
MRQPTLMAWLRWLPSGCIVSLLRKTVSISAVSRVAHASDCRQVNLVANTPHNDVHSCTLLVGRVT